MICLGILNSQNHVNSYYNIIGLIRIPPQAIHI